MLLDLTKESAYHGSSCLADMPRSSYSHPGWWTIEIRLSALYVCRFDPFWSFRCFYFLFFSFLFAVANDRRCIKGSP